MHGDLVFCMIETDTVSSTKYITKHTGTCRERIIGYMTESVLMSGKRYYCQHIEGIEGELGSSSGATLKAEGAW